MLNGIHYTKFAIRTCVATQLKRSLYSTKSNGLNPTSNNFVSSAHQRVNSANESKQAVEHPRYADVTKGQNNPAADLMSTMTSFFKKAALALPSEPNSDTSPISLS